MSDRGAAAGPALDLDDAAELLRLPVDAVKALVSAGYLEPGADFGPTGAPRFPLVDLKAFLARNAPGEGPEAPFFGGPSDVDTRGLIDALDGRAGEMALRTFEIFGGAFPETADWSDADRTRFIDQAEKRFEAILAVTSMGDIIDEALIADLRDIGAAAASSGAPLPELLVILRISRDLVVQTAIEVAEEQGRHWGLALALLLTRVLPAIDRLTDALAQGYWRAVVDREEAARARYENVVEHASNGVYEVDLDGRVIYANPALAVIVGRRRDDIVGARLADVLVPVDGSGAVEALTSEAVTYGQNVELAIARRDGSRRVLLVRAFARFEHGEIVGYQGVVHDTTVGRDFEDRKNEFLRLITHDLRQPLTTVLGLGVTLSTYAPELDAERVARIGSTIHQQAERMARLADDLHDVSGLASSELIVNVRDVHLASAIRDALSSVDGADQVTVDVAADTRVVADVRRLEQVVANLVENALTHGAAPVSVSVAAEGEDVVIVVDDHGPGVASEKLPTLFTRFHRVGRRTRDAARGGGMGLSLVRGLVEAMGGQVWYQPRPGGGASFRLKLRGSTPADDRRG